MNDTLEAHNRAVARKMLLADYAAAIVSGAHSTEVSATAHRLLNDGMAKDDIIAFELAIRAAAEAAA